MGLSDYRNRKEGWLRGAVGLLGTVLLTVSAPAGLNQPITESWPVRLAYAKAGDPGDEFNVGVAFLEGQGVAKDEKKAVEWLRQAAVRGFPDAQFALGVCLSKGDGTPVDFKEAAKWFQAAAVQGDFKAQLNLMIAYCDGRGVEKNPRAALAWDFLARRTLELEEGQNVLPPPSPAAKRTEEAPHPDEQKATAPLNEKRVTKDGQGNEEVVWPDGRKETHSADGRVETIFPDGTKTVEGDGLTKDGQRVRLQETYEPSGRRLVQRSIDAEHVQELRADGSASLEFPGEDPDGKQVTLIERFDTQKHLIGRDLVRADGTKHEGSDEWTITRWEVNGRKRMKVTERYGLGNSVIAREEHPETTYFAVAGLSPFPQSTAPFTSLPAATPPPSAAPVVIPVRIPRSPYSEEWVQKPARSLTEDLAHLQEIEKDTNNFAGTTEKDYAQAAAAAAQFIITYQNPPQKPASNSWFSQHAQELGAGDVPQPRLVEVPDDRSSLYPLGMNGQEAIASRAWKHAETEHFVVHYDQASDAYPIMRFIEAAYYIVTRTLSVEDKADKRKSHVFVFPGTTAWNAWLQKHDLPPQVAGYAYKDELLVGSGEERDEYVKTVCHEATHAIVARYYPARPLPLWLNEGLAEYMGAKSVAFKRGQHIEKYFRPNADGNIDMAKLMGCVDSGISRTFYADSEKTVRGLLEKLPPAAFPRFVNLIAAGNGPGESLNGAYGKACPSPNDLAALVRSLTTTEPSVLEQRPRR